MLTPLDIERTFGLSEGNIFQGELSLEQLFFLRPVPGWAQYATPDPKLYMCGSATHPGGGIMGAPGKNAAETHPEGRATMSAPVVVIGGGRERPGLRHAAGPRRPAASRWSSSATRSAAPPSRASWRPASACRRWRTTSGRCGPTWPATLDLEAHGLEFLAGDAWMTALDGRGRALTLWHDTARAAAAIAAFSAADAERWPAFRVAPRARLGRVVASVFDATPPSIDAPAAARAVGLLRTARQFRALGREDGYRLLRWGPMPWPTWSPSTPIPTC